MTREHNPKVALKTTKKSGHNNSSKHTKQVKEAQTVAGGALLDVEQLVEAQSILVSSQALLVQLEFPQSFVLLVAS